MWVQPHGGGGKAGGQSEALPFHHASTGRNFGAIIENTIKLKHLRPETASALTIKTL